MLNEINDNVHTIYYGWNYSIFLRKNSKNGHWRKWLTIWAQRSFAYTAMLTTFINQKFYLVSFKHHIGQDTIYIYIYNAFLWIMQGNFLHMACYESIWYLPMEIVSRGQILYRRMLSMQILRGFSQGGIVSSQWVFPSWSREKTLNRKLALMWNGWKLMGFLIFPAF